MNKIFLIVNTVLILFSLLIIPVNQYVKAQSVSPSLSQNQRTISDPLQLLRELLSLFTFNLPSSQNYPTPDPSNFPNITVTPFISGLPTQNIQSVIDLIGNIEKYCQGRVTISNVNCLNKFTVQENAKNILIADVIAYEVVQCADFAKAAAAMIDGIFWGRIGSAVAVIKSPPSGYRFIPKTIGGIHVGDYPVWTYDTYGHMAIVTKVYNATSFEVAEANFDFDPNISGSGGGVRLRDKTMTSDARDQLAGWLRKL